MIWQGTYVADELDVHSSQLNLNEGMQLLKSDLECSW